MAESLLQQQETSHNGTGRDIMALGSPGGRESRTSKYPAIGPEEGTPTRTSASVRFSFSTWTYKFLSIKDPHF
jgi:hypothetical protein